VKRFWLWLMLTGGLAHAEPFLELGASLRTFAYHALEDNDIAEQDDDSQLLILRVTGDLQLSDNWSAEVHGVWEGQRPTARLSSTLATGSTRTFFDLEDVHVHDRTMTSRLLVDRLNLRYESDTLQLVLGRQAVSWGVGRFWPSLDLFAPFAPQRLDRSYKSGVDAVRLVWAAGPATELEIIGAGLGPSLTDDGALGVLLRGQWRTIDLGVMGGSFHRDTVIGGFFEGDFRGTGVYAETAYTDSDNEADELLGEDRFWRATVGATRQLTATVSSSVELAWNEYAAESPDEYGRLLVSDRVLRGEVRGLGQWEAGVSLAWQCHPLAVLSASVLVNLNDHSSLWLPTLSISTGDNSTFDIGAVITAGPRTDTLTDIRSEHNFSPSTVYAGWTVYF
jgi:hypothetical protein